MQHCYQFLLWRHKYFFNIYTACGSLIHETPWYNFEYVVFVLVIIVVIANITFLTDLIFPSIIYLNNICFGNLIGIFQIPYILRFFWVNIFDERQWKDDYTVNGLLCFWYLIFNNEYTQKGNLNEVSQWQKLISRELNRE